MTKDVTCEFEYKCQRCGEITASCGVFGNYGTRYLCEVIEGKTGTESAMIPRESVHRCKDGGGGIEVLIGYKTNQIG